MKITAIILAAGLSRRMNRNKLKLEVNGKTLLEHVFDTVKDAHFHEVILVHSPRTALPQGSYLPVLNANPQAGVSQSIALALEAVDDNADGYVFIMADQPFLGGATLKALKLRFAKNPLRIVIPVYNGKQGSPVFFPATLRSELCQLTGDLGGRRVIQKHPELVVYEPIDSTREALDIDTPEEYQALAERKTVLVRGAGDLATGVIHVLFEKGYRVIALETATPSCIRTEVAFASCIHEGRKAIEGVTGLHILSEDLIQASLEKDLVPILIDPTLQSLKHIKPDVLVDAILAKKNLGTFKNMAPLVIALGPGFTAGDDCHAVIETMRGPELGRVITQGSAIPNTGLPGRIHGEDARRVIHSPTDGILKRLKCIGDLVEEGEIIALVDEFPIHSKLKGTLRGLIYDGFKVHTGQKIADVDPRLDPHLATTISDKSRVLGEAVALAIITMALPESILSNGKQAFSNQRE